MKEGSGYKLDYVTEDIFESYSSPQSEPVAWVKRVYFSVIKEKNKKFW